MNLAIVNLTGGGLSGGYKKYLRELTPRLRRNPSVKRVDILLPPGTCETFARELGSVGDWPKYDPVCGFRRLKARLRELSPDVVFVPTARTLDVGAKPLV